MQVHFLHQKRPHRTARTNVLFLLPILVSLFGLVVSGFPSTARAQLPTVSDERLGVDALKLQDGTRLYGFALELSGQGADRELQFSIERAWLETAYPKLAEQHAAEEVLQAERSRDTFVERVQQWIADRESEVGFTNMLRTDLAKYQSKIEEAPVATSRFAVLTFPATQVRELKVAEPTKRKIAGLAYMHSLSDVATTPASILEKRLVELQLDIAGEVDLSQDLPAISASSSDRQWVAKQALFEYQFRKPLEYQGTGTMLLKKSDEPADLAALMQSMLGSGSGANDLLQLGAELGLPEFQQFQKPKEKERDWSRKITEEAEEDGFRGLVVYRLQQDMLSPEVSVETHFLARAKKGDWFTVYRHESRVNSQRMTEAMRARIERIKQDPQIEQVTNLLSGLGLGASSQLDTALAHGAATEEALESARRSFTEFANRYGDDITYPPVPLAEP